MHRKQITLLTHPNSLGFPTTYTNHSMALLLTPLDINRCGDSLYGDQKGQKEYREVDLNGNYFRDCSH
ncbi:hypothetical protein J6TS2_42320 [Heyndrickxia sporothermodurans]|nr:hypothetical protein J6TS2_42320 [Heyndrickxia sporothermodurans]